ncbi:AMP-binding protein [Sphingomonas sp. ID0503]|uniref:AMP-binding protein n=1 Tax=Sphingomonas sp. ID0503 TaxID=3399691 RepID=UPI003AFB69FB
MIHGPPLALEAETIFLSLEAAARRVPDRDAIRFLDRGEDVTETLSFATIEARYHAFAASIFHRGLAGRPIILALPPGPDFAIAFLGCLRAGSIAVTVPWPAVGDARERLASIVADVGAATVLASARHAGGTGDCLLDGLPRLMIEDLDGAGDPPPMPSGEQPAFIQYSSGSTRVPRGIVITHRNLAANQAMIAAAFGTRPDDVGVNWLPPSHDMGLIGTLLHPLYCGITAVLMPPTAFIQKPLRWLAAIARHGGTIAGGPNFAFGLCVRRAPQAALAGLDLSRWRIAFCGAEPIHAETLRGFATHLAPSGFDASAFLPCYGMAETTLITTCARPSHGVRALSDGVVASGRPVPGATLAIEPQPDFPPGTGEIRIGGPHVSPGVWDGVAQTVRLFPAAQDGLLATGDIGRLASEGVVVIDRVKDIVIVHGRKVHAIDIEQAAILAEPAINAAAAFAVSDGVGETAVLLCELRPRELAGLDDALRERIAASVADRTGISPRLRFVRSGALPRTTSGKIRRQAARAAYLSGLLHDADRAA